MENDGKCLIDKTRTVYYGEVCSLSSDLILQLISELGNGWIINELGQLYKKCDFDNFVDVMKFANKVAELAEVESHHPDLEISWGKCIIKIWTHKINGLTKNDFILATKINILLYKR